MRKRERERGLKARGFSEGKWRDRQRAIVNVCSYMDFGANDILRTVADRSRGFVRNYQANL